MAPTAVADQRVSVREEYPEVGSGGPRTPRTSRGGRYLAPKRRDCAPTRRTTWRTIIPGSFEKGGTGAAAASVLWAFQARAARRRPKRRHRPPRRRPRGLISRSRHGGVPLTPTTPSFRPTDTPPEPIAASSPIWTASLPAPGAMARGSIAAVRSAGQTGAGLSAAVDASGNFRRRHRPPMPGPARPTAGFRPPCARRARRRAESDGRRQGQNSRTSKQALSRRSANPPWSFFADQTWRQPQQGAVADGLYCRRATRRRDLSRKKLNIEPIHC